MIKVLKLPNDMNIDNRIKKKMLEVYGTCPYCNNPIKENNVNYDCFDYGYGYRKDSLGRTLNEIVDYKIEDAGLDYIDIDRKSKFFNRQYNWQKMVFTCMKCGMKWEAPKYPLVGDDSDANTAIFHAWEQGKNMEVNTILLSCMNKKE